MTQPQNQSNANSPSHEHGVMNNQQPTDIYGRSRLDPHSDMAKALEKIPGTMYQESVTVNHDTLFAMTRSDRGEKQLVQLCPRGGNGSAPRPEQGIVPSAGTTTTISANGSDFSLMIGPLSADNAAYLRKQLPFLTPCRFGTDVSFGAGDRLGLATPGHIQAIEAVRGQHGNTMRPILAQQSIREMTRTHRQPQQVMDTAMWGAFQQGYQLGFGADADHLKTTDDIDYCLNAGFVLFTIDPGDHVNSNAETMDQAGLQQGYEQLDWATLEDSPADCRGRYLDREFPLDHPVTDNRVIRFDQATLLRAAVKYAPAVAHVKTMYRHLLSRSTPDQFELEVSVDETATPTTLAEHYYVAAELRRLLVQWVSLAPRFIGEFEKGVDYIGDLDRFRADFAGHVAIARQLGPYKISLHSGSDKFSIYPIAAELAQGLVHLKTAGTSYLEALRAVAAVEPELFREILAFAIERYPEDRATYHVSAVLEKIARPESLSDQQLAEVLDQFDTREACHVTFGSVLTSTHPDGAPRFRERLMSTLDKNERVYYDILEHHIGRHVAPFARYSPDR